MPNYTWGNRLQQVLDPAGLERLGGILGGLDQNALNPLNRGGGQWGMSDLARLRRSGLVGGNDLNFIYGINQGQRAAGLKPWQQAGQVDPRSVRPGGGARRDIRRQNRQQRRAGPQPAAPSPNQMPSEFSFGDPRGQLRTPINGQNMQFGGKGGGK